MDRSLIRERIPVYFLLAVMLIQLVDGIRWLSPTYDEHSHLPSGYTYLRTGDFRLNPQHPPLIKLLAAAPLLALDPGLNLEDPAWQEQPPDEWAFGFRFLYENNAEQLILLGRLPIVLISLLLAIYVFRWARELFGAEAGLLALALCAFSPTVIGHGRLVTFDVALACFSIMTLYHLWRFHRNGGNGQLAATGIALGLALASKYSALILLPVCAFLLLFGLRLQGGNAESRTAPVRALVTGTAVLALALLVVQATYLFSGDLFAYWKGLALVQQDRTAQYAYYLMGEFREEGWWYYFPVAFLLKTPAPTLVLLAIALVLFRRYRAQSVTDELFLVVPVLSFLIVTSALADNLGVRYLLPIYPLVFIFISRLALWMREVKAARGAGIFLGAWYLATTIAIHPDQLSYFSDLVGGAPRGHLYLDDSNIDWGQDMKRLKSYMDKEGIETVRLYHNGNVSPRYYRINATPVSNSDWTGDPSPGLYAMGTNTLIRGRHIAQTSGVKTDWIDRYKPVGRIGYSIWLFEFR